MSEHVLVRSNWTPVHSLSLDLVCDVGFQEEEQSTVPDEQKEKHDDDDHPRLVSYSYLRVSRERKRGRAWRMSMILLDEHLPFRELSLVIIRSARVMTKLIRSSQGSERWHKCAIHPLDETCRYVPH